MAAMSEPAWTDYDIGYGRAARPAEAKPPAAPPPARWTLTKVALLFLVFVVVTIASAVGIRRAAQDAQQRFHDQLVADAFKQYKIVAQGDDAMAKSLHAGVVAEAFLMAKDGENYHKWKKVSDEWDALAKRQIEADTRRQIQRFSR
jgi:hypothetical protein